MNRFLIFSFLLMALLLCRGCHEGDNKTEKTVSLAPDSITQEGAFRKSNGEMCHMKVNVTISYPAGYNDSTVLPELQQLFNREVLGAPKAITQVKDALRYYAQSLLNSNTPSGMGSTRASNDTIAGDLDEIDVDRFESSVNISVVFNSHNIISFCKESTIRKNNRVSSVSHHYVNIDLDSMKRIGLNDLFRDDCLEQVTKNLKRQLMTDKDADNEDELNDFGYFNLPNLTVTGNFFFTPDGITWSYDSGVVAVASVGEPTINLDYDDLKSLKCDHSLLDRF